MRDVLVALVLVVVAIIAVGTAARGEGDPKADKPTTQPTTKPQTPPKSNLDYWLNRATEVKDADKADGAPEAANPFTKKEGFHRPDALPGVLEFSDGTQVPGWHYTTREKDWEVYIAKEKRWRLVPFINVLSISAVVVEERLEQRWRWKEMGAPERIYTGKQYPFRRFEWKLHLIDGSTMQGAIKGQPMWVEHNRTKHGPYVFNERQKGEDDQTLKDLIYMKKIVISRKMMDKVLLAQKDDKTVPAEK
jgi:hypothetical protein